MFTPKQLKAARGLAGGLSVDRLADLSGVNRTSIALFEAGKSVFKSDSADKITTALLSLGIEFTRTGVDLRNEVFRIIKANYMEFFDDVYHTAQEKGGEVLVTGVEESKYDELLGENAESHVARMSRLKGVKFRVIINEEDENEAGESYVEYRAVPSKLFAPIPFTVYGQKLAIILWGDPHQILIIEHQKLTEAYRNQFELLWAQSTPVE